MKIFLTGGRGFIGRNLIEQLGSQYSIAAPAHKELDLLNAQAVRDFLSANKFEIIIHSANFGGSRSQTELSGVLETNKKMFLHLAENKNSFGRIIFLGSGAEYGKQNPIIRAKETDFGKIKPQDEYGRAKYFASEQIVSMPNALCLRCFGVFGKYEDYTTRFISNAICRALCGLPIVIRQNVVFDYLYVDDLVKIIKYFIDNEPKEKFYNAGGGEGVELLILANIVKSATGGKAEIIIKNPGLGKEYTCDNSLLRSEIPSLYFTPFEVAIKQLTEWYRRNLSKIDKNKLNFDA